MPKYVTKLRKMNNIKYLVLVTNDTTARPPYHLPLGEDSLTRHLTRGKVRNELRTLYNKYEGEGKKGDF